MADDISPLKGIMSLRHIVPTLWYFAADTPKLVEPLRDLTFFGLTRPWSFVGAATLLFGLVHKKVVETNLELVRYDDFSVWSWADKFDVWLVLVLPFILLFHINVSSKVREPPPAFATAALWLYIFGIYVLVFLALGDLVSWLTNTPYPNQPLLFKVLLNVSAIYLFFFRSAWAIILLHKSETGEEIDNILGGVGAAASGAFFIFVAASFFFHWIKWRPSKLVAPILAWFTGGQ